MNRLGYNSWNDSPDWKNKSIKKSRSYRNIEYHVKAGNIKIIALAISSSQKSQPGISTILQNLFLSIILQNPEKSVLKQVIIHWGAKYTYHPLQFGGYNNYAALVDGSFLLCHLLEFAYGFVWKRGGKRALNVGWCMRFLWDRRINNGCFVTVAYVPATAVNDNQ